jgi:hypothetical protein
VKPPSIVPYASISPQSLFILSVPYK